MLSAAIHDSSIHVFRPLGDAATTTFKMRYFLNDQWWCVHTSPYPITQPVVPSFQTIFGGVFFADGVGLSSKNVIEVVSFSRQPHDHADYEPNCEPDDLANCEPHKKKK